MEVFEEIKDVQGDPYFVVFILFYYNLLGASDVDVVSEEERRIYQKQLKAKVKEEKGKGWKQFWKETDKSIPNEELKIQKGLIITEPLRDNPRNRPDLIPVWSAVHQLHEYFLLKSGKAHWRLIKKILMELCGKKWSQKTSLKSEFSKRKHWLQKNLTNPLIPLERLLTLYEPRKEAFKLSVKTRTALFDVPFNK
jgi:hypothetical protein